MPFVFIDLQNTLTDIALELLELEEFLFITQKG